jgi:CubicO group peptidase (beta-lactamase class C family)
MSFGKYLERNIFKPLGMTSSLAYEAKTTIKNRAFGYQVNADNDKFARADQDKATAVLGDGGIYSSITDIAKWVDALEKGTLIKGKRFAEAISTQVKTNDPAVGYGYGFRIGQEQGEKVVWHTGTTSGFKNALLWVPSRKLAVVVLTNRKQSDSLRLAWRVLEHFWDR